MKFYRCEKCGQIVAIVEKKTCPVMCCGQAMEEIVPGTSDGAREKHVPVFEVKDNVVHVKVGEVDHPMLEEHHIAWIALETKMGNQRKELDHTGAPEAKFALLEGDEVVAVYEYCNLHGLFKA